MKLLIGPVLVLLFLPDPALCLIDPHSQMKLGGKEFSIITVEDPPFVSVREQPFNKSSPLLPTSQWSGYMIELLQETAKRGDFTYKLQLPSSTFSYGAAYNELAAGEADVCWSAAYITQDRLRRTILTTGFQTAPLSLLVKQVDTADVYEALGWADLFVKPFEPFTPALWLTVLFMFPCAGMLYALIEPMNHSDFNVRGNPKALHPIFSEICSHVAAGGGMWQLFFNDIGSKSAGRRVSVAPKDLKGGLHHRTIEETMQDLRQRKRQLVYNLSREAADIMLSSTFLAFCAFTGSHAWEPSTWKGKSFTATWTFWCVIIVAAYTANLAVFLSFQPSEFYPNTFENFYQHATFAPPATNEIDSRQLKGGGGGGAAAGGAINSGASGFSSSFKMHEIPQACVLANSAYGKWLKSDYRYKHIKQVPAVNLEDMLQKLKTGECHGVIERLSHNEFIEGGSFSGSDLCDQLASKDFRVKVADSLTDGPLQLAIGLYKGDGDVVQEAAARNDAAKISYWMTELVSTGHTLELYNIQVKQGHCFGYDGNVAKHSAAQPLNAWHMAGGAILVLLVGIACGAATILGTLQRHWVTYNVVYDVQFARQRLVFSVEASKRIRNIKLIKEYQNRHKKCFIIYGTADNDTKDLASKVFEGKAVWTNAHTEDSSTCVIACIDHVDFTKDELTMEIELLSGSFDKPVGLSIVESFSDSSGSSYALDGSTTQNTLLKISWIMEYGIKSKFIKNRSRTISKVTSKSVFRPDWAAGDVVRVQDIEYRNHKGRQANAGGWRTAVILGSSRDTSALQRLEKVVCTALEFELSKNNPNMERKPHWPVLYSICYNWPELQKAIVERWCIDTSFRNELRKPVGDFLESDYELWNDADDWELDADSIEAIHEVRGHGHSQGGQLTKFVVFEKQKERLQKALARYHRRSIRHKEHDILNEQALVKENSPTDLKVSKKYKKPVHAHAGSVPFATSVLSRSLEIDAVTPVEVAQLQEDRSRPNKEDKDQLAAMISKLAPELAKLNTALAQMQ